MDLKAEKSDASPMLNPKQHKAKNQEEKAKLLQILHGSWWKKHVGLQRVENEGEDSRDGERRAVEQLHVYQSDDALLLDSPQLVGSGPALTAFY